MEEVYPAGGFFCFLRQISKAPPAYKTLGGKDAYHKMAGMLL